MCRQLFELAFVSAFITSFVTILLIFILGKFASKQEILRVYKVGSGYGFEDSTHPLRMVEDCTLFFLVILHMARLAVGVAGSMERRELVRLRQISQVLHST